ncbi:SUI1 domain-containing protein [Pseudoscourfieldia marina]
MSAVVAGVSVNATKAGALPVSLELRKGHAVTLVANVVGDARALLNYLQENIGCGGTVANEGNVIELQGRHEEPVKKLLLDAHVAKGVAGTGKKALAKKKLQEQQQKKVQQQNEPSEKKERLKPRREKRPAAQACLIVDNATPSLRTPPPKRKRTHKERYDAFVNMMTERWPYWSREPSELPAIYGMITDDEGATATATLGAAILEAKPGEVLSAGGEEALEDPLSTFSVTDGANRRERLAAAKAKAIAPKPAQPVQPVATPIAWTAKAPAASTSSGSYAFAAAPSASASHDVYDNAPQRSRNRLGQMFDPRRAAVRSQIHRSARGGDRRGGGGGGGGGRVFVKQRHRGGSAGRAARWGGDDDDDGGSDDDGPSMIGSAVDWFHRDGDEDEEHREEEHEKHTLDSWFTARAPLPDRRRIEEQPIHAFAASSIHSYEPAARHNNADGERQRVLPHLFQPAELSEEEALAMALAMSAREDERHSSDYDDDDDDDDDYYGDDDGTLRQQEHASALPQDDEEAQQLAAALEASRLDTSAAAPRVPEEEEEQLAAALEASLRDAPAPVVATWSCPACTLENALNVDCCDLCGGPSPRIVQLASET